MKQLKTKSGESNKLYNEKGINYDEASTNVPHKETKEKSRDLNSAKTCNLADELCRNNDENSPLYNLKKVVGFNDEEISSIDQDIKSGIIDSPAEIKDMSPEHILIKEAEQNKIGGVYGALIKKDPALAGAILLDFAKQKYGIDDQGKVMKGAAKVILSKKIDWAVTKAFPEKEAVIEVINNIDTAGNNKKDGHE